MPTKRKSAASPKESSTATVRFGGEHWFLADKVRNKTERAANSVQIHGKTRLEREGITYKQTPYAFRTR